MDNNIYLYGPITQTAAESFNRQLEWYQGEPVNIRMATPGGFTSAGSAMLTKLEEHTGKVTMYVDGEVYSMGAFMTIFADEVIMSDLGELGFHKAVYKQATAEQQIAVDNLNVKIRTKMESRLGDAGKELIEKVFQEGVRNDVFLDSEKAKKLGLANRVVALEPRQKAAFELEFHKQMSMTDKPKDDKVNININSNTMEITQEDLDKRIQAAKEAGKAEGELAGIELGKQAELGRVESWQAFDTVDPVAVKAGIESGKAMSDSERNKFLLKAATSKEAKADDKENTGDNDTTGKEALLTVEAQKEAANKKELEELIGVKLD